MSSCTNIVLYYINTVHGSVICLQEWLAELSFKEVLFSFLLRVHFRACISLLLEKNSCYSISAVTGVFLNTGTKVKEVCTFAICDKM